MRRLEADRDGRLSLIEVEAPVAGAGQVVAAVTTIGVNFRDVRQRRGDYGGRRLHGEGVGRVVDVGEGVTCAAVGDRIAWVDADDHYAERVLVGAAQMIPLPGDVSDELAAAILLQGLTAHYLTHDAYAIATGETAVVHAAAGGVGLLLTQVLSRLGAHVIAVTSTTDKARRAAAAGARWTLTYDAFPVAALELTDGTGVDVIYDGVGRATLADDFDALRVRGTVVMFGASSGEPDPIDTRVLFRKSHTLMRVSRHHFMPTTEMLRTRAAEVFEWLRTGFVEPRIGGHYSFADAQRAHDDLEQRRTSGKLLITLG
jgi:NADPH:quinone reductase